MIPLPVQRAARQIRSHKYLHGVCALTIALSVFIVSAFTLFYLNVTEVLDAWRKGLRIIAYLGDDAVEAERRELITAVTQLEGVAHVNFISRETAFAELKERIGEQTSLLAGLTENPLPDALEIRLSDTYHDLADIEKLVERIWSLEHVDDVEYAQKWLHRFKGIYNLFQVTGMVLVWVFFMATLMITANTVRLIMFARREEIEIMRIVGADDAFIKYPLYIQSMGLGFIGALAGMAALFLAYLMTLSSVGSAAVLSLVDIRFIPPALVAGIILLSMMIGWLGCWLSIRKFLKF
jgi:cell division transport system permease protein